MAILFRLVAKLLTPFAIFPGVNYPLMREVALVRGNLTRTKKTKTP